MNWLELAVELREIRLNRKISLRKLGEKSGVSYAEICRFEKGINNIKLDTYVRLCNGLNVNIFVK
jgi:transcriptional regulator with XRE-family HTH domain